MSSFLHNILDNYLYYKNRIVQTFAIAKELKPVKDFRRIKTIIIRLGFSQKKAPNLYLMGLLAYFVTTKVEKSNFYKDLERVIDIDFKKIDTKNKTT